MNLKKISDLLNCELFIFDLDGTVYEETAHFEYYGQRLAERMPNCAPDIYLAEVERALEGTHPLSYGSSYDAVNRVIVRDGKVYDWAGAETSLVPAQKLVHVDDPWTIYGVAAAHHGLPADELDQAFLATRQHMESELFPMHGMTGLRAAIDHLQEAGRKFVLATNSPEPDSRVILEKLGLTGAFEDHVFNARKQERATEHFTRWQHHYDIPFERMVSIGDHYRNEIKPASDLGMKTLYIDRYMHQPRAGVTVQVDGPSEVAMVLEEVYTRI